MSIPFSESTNNSGICQQARVMVGLDSVQWPTSRIVNSSNNWLDFVAGYAIGADKRFQWDDTNHSFLPEGTMPSITTSPDYSFLVDENGNKIITLLGISRLDSATGKYIPLTLVDRKDIDLATFGTTTGTPTQYDKISDNIIRLNYKVGSVISAYLKFFFQRTPSYFSVTDTTKSPGVSPLLHRGFVIASAYDAALSKAPDKLQALSLELEKEKEKIITYFFSRNNDEQTAFKPYVTSCE